MCIPGAGRNPIYVDVVLLVSNRSDSQLFHGLSINWGKSLNLIPVALSVDPDPEVCDPDPTACDPDPNPVIPDPAYHVMPCSLMHQYMHSFHWTCLST